MSRRIALVTGANRGIGFDIAEGLARAGFHVVVVSRDPERGRAACERLALRSKVETISVSCLEADLSRIAAVVGLAEIFRTQHERLDLLVNNAASVPGTRQLTEDGLELQFAVNHVAPFLLTRLLEPALARAPSAQIINMTSEAHRAATHLDFNNLQAEKTYGRWDAYCRSKLLNLLFTYELARRLENQRLRANAIHPGLIGTRLLGDIFAPFGWFSFLYGSTSRGAAPVVRLATDPALASANGKYFHRYREAQSSALSRDSAAGKRLWQLTEDIVAAHIR